MEMEYIIIKMEIYIQANEKMIYLMVLDCNFFKNKYLQK